MGKYELINNPGVIAALAHEGVDKAAVWRRIVWDGEIRCVVILEPAGWHMSISHRYATTGKRARLKSKRYPTFPEIAQARDELLEDLPFICTVPTLEETVELRDTTVDLYEFPPPGSAGQEGNDQATRLGSRGADIDGRRSGHPL